jgi:hypothetical protein
VSRSCSDRIGDGPQCAPNRFEAQMEGLRQVAELLRRQLADVREDHDRWRTQAESVTRQLTNHRRPWWSAGRWPSDGPK